MPVYNQIYLQTVRAPTQHHSRERSRRKYSILLYSIHTQAAIALYRQRVTAVYLV